MKRRPFHWLANTRTRQIFEPQILRVKWYAGESPVFTVWFSQLALDWWAQKKFKFWSSGVETSVCMKSVELAMPSQFAMNNVIHILWCRSFASIRPLQTGISSRWTLWWPLFTFHWHLFTLIFLHTEIPRSNHPFIRITKFATYHWPSGAILPTRDSERKARKRWSKCLKFHHWSSNIKVPSLKC